MHPLFSITLYTGQQLVLEAVSKWLPLWAQRHPCEDAEASRQRRRGLKGLVLLLLKTAATGVLATLLDAAIEYRRWQLLSAADPAASDDGFAPGAGSLPPPGVLSRAGIAAWKARLILCIDAMERQAQHYGIEPRYRHTEGKEGVPAADKAPALARSPSAADLPAGGERQKVLTRTVEQLRELVQTGDEGALDAQVEDLLDSLLGLDGSPSPADTAGRPAGLAAVAGGGAAADTCNICMDRPVQVQVGGCAHDLCFQCARQLCLALDHQIPQCPFCRQAIGGFQARPAQG